MTRFVPILVIWLLLFLTLAPVSGAAEETTKEDRFWSTVQPGLALARFNAEYQPLEGLSPREAELGLVALRIDPDTYRFRLLSASELDSEGRSLEEWTEEFGLVAAINAGMFWRDQRTSTGYMRNFGHLNQSHIHPDYGGFLVFNPRSSDLPRVQIVDRFHRSGWRDILKQYASVVQSYRIIGRNRVMAWKTEGERYSASCIAEDADGHILFLHNEEPLTMRSFSRLLLELPLRIEVCLFTEGGHHAGLSLDTPLVKRSWPPAEADGFWSGGETPSIPNIVAIEPRKRSLKWPVYGIVPLGF